MSSGIAGLDLLTGGGLPAGRVTVVMGSAGCGKTVFSLQGLVAGARAGETGLFVAFEEHPSQIIEDTRGFAWDLNRVRGVDFIDAQLAQSIVRGGEFDLLGLLAIVGAKVDSVGCRRVIFDGIDVLLDHLGDPLLVQREMLRLREWVHDTNTTVLVTAKVDASTERVSSRYDFLQFLADCVITLQHRVTAGAAGRTLRVAKFRGTAHSSNEFPFTIDHDGIQVVGGAPHLLDHPVSKERVSSGVEALDVMLHGGYYRGSSVLISGAPGTSKTSLASAFAEAACRRGERTVYVSFDEAPAQIVRNVASIGIDFQAHLKSGVLALSSLRARSDNPEAHVARIRALIERHQAKNLVVDPLSALAEMGDPSIADRAAIEVLEAAKARGVTGVSTSLLGNQAPLSEEALLGVSTIADTWMHVSYVSRSGERNRALTIVKSRGTGHSHQVRELILSDTGITLAAPYLAGGEVLMGTLRWEHENAERMAKATMLAEAAREQRRAEMLLAESRLRVEAALVDRAMCEADLERLATTTQGDDEANRKTLAGRATRRGAAAVVRARPPSPAPTKALATSAAKAPARP